MIAPAQYLNQPEAVLNQVLTASSRTGWATSRPYQTGGSLTRMPWQTYVWMLTQR
jgi:nitrate/nitrite transport system substrate-binding protein